MVQDCILIDDPIPNRVFKYVLSMPKHTFQHGQVLGSLTCGGKCVKEEVIL